MKGQTNEPEGWKVKWTGKGSKIVNQVIPVIITKAMLLIFIFLSGSWGGEEENISGQVCSILILFS